MSESIPEDDILIRREGRAGRITLNRPKALNALTYDMILRIAAALEAWVADPDVALVLIDGTGERAMCAGGDVRALYDSRPQGSGFVRKFWADEYRLNAFIKRYPKPYVAIQDGIVMGGGIGVSSHGSHRVVTERSHLAMPETAIGLIPDVGGTWILARAPGAAGLYLGLTGEPMKAADALYAQFADTFVPADRLGELKARLCDPAAGSVDAVLASLTGDAGEGQVARLAAPIAQAFSAPGVEEIMQRLAAMPDAWAQKTRETLATKSPKALKLAFAAITGARSLRSLEEALEIEYRLVVRLFEDGEFPEGVRALIVDKDKKPQWQPATLDAVSDAQVAAYLAPFPDPQNLTFANA